MLFRHAIPYLRIQILALEENEQTTVLGAFSEILQMDVALPDGIESPLPNVVVAHLLFLFLLIVRSFSSSSSSSSSFSPPPPDHPHTSEPNRYNPTDTEAPSNANTAISDLSIFDGGLTNP